MRSRSAAIMARLIALTLLALASNACGPSATGATASPPEGTPVSDHFTIEHDVTWGAGPFILEDPRVSLSNLSSYSATLTMSFDGTNAGKPSKWMKTYLMLARKDPAARQLTIQKTGDLPNLEPVYMAERAGAVYSWQGEETCTAELITEDNSLSQRLEPAAFLHFVVGAKEAGAETANGVPSMHYTFDEPALAQQDLTESTGELWIASDGGYVVKYLLTSKGGANFFGEGIEGTLSIDYELTGVDGPVAIDIPADCPSGLIDAPQLADASNVESDLGLLIYTSASTIKDAVAFHQQELPKLGWQPVGEQILSDESAFLTFERGGEDMLVVITLEDTFTNVQIALLSKQE